MLEHAQELLNGPEIAPSVAETFRMFEVTHLNNLNLSGYSITLF